MQEVSPTSQTNSYLQTEFLFYMLPCYLIIPSFIYRYYMIMKIRPEIDIQTIPGQFLILSIQNNDYVGRKQTPTPSYIIKCKLSLFNSYMYIFMILMSIIGDKRIFYASQHRAYCVFYIFGFAAWQMSAYVLRREYMRKISQSLWTHRIFWIYTATLAVTKMFQDYFLPLNVIINCFWIVANMILAFYAIYRPQNNNTLEMIHNEDTPYFARFFFQFIELNPYIRFIFRIKDEQQNQNEVQVIDDDIKQTLQNEQIDIKQIEQSFQPTAKTIKQQLNLLNTLPRRNIFIDRKIRYAKINDTFKNYYFIISQIGNERFQSQKQLSQFFRLEQTLLNVFNEKNFPKLTLPRLQRSVQPNQESVVKAEILQQWLQKLTQNPIFIIEELLQFLNVNEEMSAPFKTYFEVSHRSFCSNLFRVNYLKKKYNTASQRPSLIGYYQEKGQNQEQIKVADLIKTKLAFEVYTNQEIKADKQYGFEIVCDSIKKPKLRWKISKQQEAIKALNQKIQQQCRLTVPFYYRILSKISSHKLSHQSKAEGFREYLDQLLKNQKYYCTSLFQFIRFDPVNVKVMIIGANISFGELQKQQRQSRYMEQFDQSNQEIQILRVDRLDQDSYKVLIKRKGFRLTKFTQHVLNLRENLVKMYRGVATIPEFNISKCHKNQVKERVEKFLRKVEQLPKININKAYHSFYENSLPEVTNIK